VRRQRDVSEKLWKGEGRKQPERTRASVRVGGAGSVARIGATRGIAAGRAGAGGSLYGSLADRWLDGALKGCARGPAVLFYPKQERWTETQHGSTRECREVQRNRETD
jgi:hypothetical protein